MEAETLAEILRKSIALFGDKLYIKHTPTQQQEGRSSHICIWTLLCSRCLCHLANAQVVLLAAGYVRRENLPELESIARSGLYLTAITNRLAASSPRSRFLGMIVGMAISRLIDAPDKVLKFTFEEMESNEAIWYLGLTNIKDQVGSVMDLIPGVRSQIYVSAQNLREVTKLSGVADRPPLSSQKASEIISIETIPDDSESDGLVSYEKPDTDASDSEEDPTLIERSKPHAPV